MRLHWSASLAFSHGKEKEPFGNPMIGELFEILVSNRLKIKFKNVLWGNHMVSIVIKNMEN